MSKKLITVKNYQEFVCGNQLFITKDMIVTPGAKDELRKNAVEIVYASCECEVKKAKEDAKNNASIDETIVQILVKDFKITDEEIIAGIVKRVRKLL